MSADVETNHRNVDSFQILDPNSLMRSDEPTGA